MNSASLTASFSDPTAISSEASYWLRFDQTVKDDGATIGEAAELIDEIYGIDPCNDASAKTGGEEAEVDDEGQIVSPLTKEEVFERAQSILEWEACRIDPDSFNFQAEIKIIKSHRTEPYKLIFSNGELDDTIKEQTEITINIVVDDAASVDLEWPVVASPVVSWRGVVTDDFGICANPSIALNGSTLSFGKNVSGHLTAQFLTEYDLCTVTVFGDATTQEVGECMITALYHGNAYQHDVTAPVVDENMSDDNKVDLCTPPKMNPKDDVITCYKIIHKLTKCKCDETVVDEEWVEESCECPDTVKYCPNGKEECRHFLGTETQTVARVNCTNSDDYYSDPDYFEYRCCAQPSKPMPRCRVVKTIFQGGKGIAGGADKYKALYGDNVRLVAVSPKDGICGETTITQQWMGADCCDGVSAIAFDTGASVSVLADNSSGIVTVTGGIAPYTWKVRGNGFWLDQNHTIRDGNTDTPWVRIYTSNACGPCYITATDNCSQATYSLRSTTGSWVKVYENVSGGIDDTVYPIPFVVSETTGADNQWKEHIQGIVKVRQNFTRRAARVYAARRPYSPDATSFCASQESPPPAWLTTEKLSGSCFTFENTCMGCTSGCDQLADEYTFSFDLGFHALITKTCTPTSGWCYVITGWSYVGYSTVWEWRC